MKCPECKSSEVLEDTYHGSAVVFQRICKNCGWRKVYEGKVNTESGGVEKEDRTIRYGNALREIQAHVSSHGANPAWILWKIKNTLENGGEGGARVEVTGKNIEAFDVEGNKTFSTKPTKTGDVEEWQKLNLIDALNTPHPDETTEVGWVIKTGSEEISSSVESREG